MRSINVFGTFNGVTGYDHVVRNIVERMYFKGIVVGLHDFKEWSGTKIPTSVLLQNMVKSAPAVRSDMLLAFCLPEQIYKNKNLHQGKIIANYTMMETDRIPRNWVDYGASSDVIIVPTQFNKKAWIESGVNENRLEVVPLGIDTGMYNPKIHPLPLYDGDELINDKYKYRFLNIQEAVDRKNLDGILESWMTATKDRDDCCLILKLSSYSENRLDFFGTRMDRIREKVGIRKEEHAPIFIYSNMLLDSQMPSLISACTHYVSLSFGEGWDLNMIAAASMNKQLIAPDNSSYKEYLNNEIAFMIDTKLEPAAQSGPTARIYHGSNWARPQMECVLDTYEKIFNGEVKEEARETIAGGYTWDHTVDNLIKTLDRRFYGTKEFALPKEAEKEKTGVMLVCKSNVGSEKCGILEYSKSLIGALQNAEEKLDKVGLMGGNEPTYVDHIDNNEIALVHYQYEYQFHSPSRLKFMFRELKARGVKIVVTQHTLTKEAAAHNCVIRDYADAIIVHSDRSKEYAAKQLGYDIDKVKKVTMPCNPIIEKFESTVPLPKDKMKVGFFGFSYYHKGINKLIINYYSLKQHEAFKDLMLVIVSNKPKQDHVGYYEQCVNMLNYFGLKNKEDYIWIDKFLPEEQAVGYLNQCDCIILPYDDYGGVGTSAAIRTAMRAGKPVFASDTCWFSDIPEIVVPRINDDNFEGDLKSLLSEIKDKEKANALSGRVKKYVERNSWGESARQHREIYQTLIGT